MSMFRPILGMNRWGPVDRSYPTLGEFSSREAINAKQGKELVGAIKDLAPRQENSGEAARRPAGSHSQAGGRQAAWPAGRLTCTQGPMRPGTHSSRQSGDQATR